MSKYFNKYIGRNTEYYGWFFVNILLHPQTVYETCRYQFGLTHQWNRRDHAITKIVVIINVILSFVFGITFVNPYYIIPYILMDVLIPIIIGIVISLIIYNLSTHYFTTGDTFTIRYSYDIHVNAYFCYLLTSHIIIFILSPFLFHDTFISTLISNLLMLFAIAHYCYITFLGYQILPFITVPKKAYIIPIIFAGVFFVITTLFDGMLRY
ncbi:Yip1 domain-containing protein [Entamoeba marina]